MRLLPREERFFQYFQAQVRILTDATRLLADSVKLGNSELAAAVVQIGDLEKQGDKIVHEVFTRLNQTFITPFDPEDIHSLSSRLDDVLDALEEVAHRMGVYRLEPIPPSVVELCRITKQSADCLGRAFEALGRQASVAEHCVEVNRLEEAADDVFRTALASMFVTEKDAIRLMQLKEVHEMLEQVTDRCEDVADALQGILVKNS